MVLNFGLYFLGFPLLIKSQCHFRYAATSTIAGTQKIHLFIPVSFYELSCKFFSIDTKAWIERVSETSQALQDSEINGYISISFNNQWHIGLVVSKNVEY